MPSPKSNVYLALVLALLIAGSCRAQTKAESAEEATDRYLRVVPIDQLLADTTAELAKQVPADQRASFVAEFRRFLRPEPIERIARAAMLRTFTAEEISAMADFYTSPHGASAMRKFGSYMSQVLPATIAEVQRAAKEMQGR